MIRITAFVALALLLAGCSRVHTRAQGPFAKPAKEPPPPYGAATPHPVGNNSPLGIASAEPAPPLPPDEQMLIPPRPNGLVPAGGVVPGPNASTSALPPFRRRPDPTTLPSPFAPKDPPAATTPPAVPAAPAAPVVAKNMVEMKALLARANASWKGIDTYEATLTRRELNPKGEVNSEVLVFQFRREPMSVYILNIGENGKGRETIYNPGKHGDKLHVKLGKGDPFPAGFVAPPISPDDPRVKAKARYSIRDAGFGRSIDVLSAAVAKVEAGTLSADALAYEAEVTRPEFTFPLVGVTHKLRPGDDPLLPAGGTRVYFFDMRKDSPAYALPVLAVATEASGKEAEYYLFEKIKSPANLTDADFDPARLKKK